MASPPAIKQHSQKKTAKAALIHVITNRTQMQKYTKCIYSRCSLSKMIFHVLYGVLKMSTWYHFASAADV